MGTLVCFHAHPDDESIATAGSMVAAAADGHPVVLVVATLGEAAGRLAAVLREEGADVVTIYDENGVYGHPDHVQVHRVGTRAAALAGTPRGARPGRGLRGLDLRRRVGTRGRRATGERLNEHVVGQGWRSADDRQEM